MERCCGAIKRRRDSRVRMLGKCCVMHHLLSRESLVMRFTVLSVHITVELIVFTGVGRSVCEIPNIRHLDIHVRAF
jgi:hypothetical protein